LDRLIREFLVAKDWAEARSIIVALKPSPALGLKRHKILSDCMRILPLHGKDRFNAANLVVPTLLGIVDGIIADFAERNLGMANWHVKKGKPAVETALRSVCYAFDEPALALVFDILFATAWGKAPPASKRWFNRHKIVHGNWLEFGRIEYVLRLLLVISFLCCIVDEYEARTSIGSVAPVTQRSLYSHALSTNPLAQFHDQALEHLIARGIQPMQFSPIRRIEPAAPESANTTAGDDEESNGANEATLAENKPAPAEDEPTTPA
jgi:hypothetical protein